jgi:sucrose-phosphate synthase
MPSPSHLPTADRWLISDIDNTLIGDREALADLLALIKASAGQIAFGVASGRGLESALEVLDEWEVPLPDVLVTSVGSEIYYGPGLVRDDTWAQHIRSRWRRDAIEDALRLIPGLKLQSRLNQRPFKISYNIDAARFPPLAEVRRHIHSRRLMANFIVSHGAYLDVLPIRASKGRAIKYLAYRWGLPLNRTLVAGDSGNDEEMLKGDTLGVVVGNYSPELERLRGTHQVYFADGKFARGILESLRHYAFLPVDAKGKILLNSVECREEATCQAG